MNLVPHLGNFTSEVRWHGVKTIASYVVPIINPLSLYNIEDQYYSIFIIVDVKRVSDLQESGTLQGKLSYIAFVICC
jgi:hypothetical protein